MTDETPQSEGEPSPAVPEETPTAETTPLTRRRGTAPPTSPRPPGGAGGTDAGGARRRCAADGAAEERPRRDLHPEVGRPRRRRDRRRARVRRHRLRDRRLVVGLGSTENASNSPDTANGKVGQRSVPGGEQLPNGDDNDDGNGDGTTAATPASSVSACSGRRQGVEVTEVASDSPAAKAGLQTGDVITAIDGNDVTTPVALRVGGAGQAERRRDHRHLHPRRRVEHRGRDAHEPSQAQSS